MLSIGLHPNLTSFCFWCSIFSELVLLEFSFHISFFNFKISHCTYVKAWMVTYYLPYNWRCITGRWCAEGGSAVGGVLLADSTGPGSCVCRQPHSLTSRTETHPAHPYAGRSRCSGWYYLNHGQRVAEHAAVQGKHRQYNYLCSMCSLYMYINL